MNAPNALDRPSRRVHPAPRRAATPTPRLLLLAVLALSALPARAVTGLQPTWTAGGLSAGNDSAGQAARMAVDGAGNIAIVSGPALARSLAVTSYTPAGVPRWRGVVSPASGTFVGDWVAAAPSGEVVATGRNLDSRGTTIGVTMVRFGADGQLQWRIDRGVAFSGVGRVVMDAGGNAYLAWSARGIGRLVEKYGPTGSLLWSQLDGTAGGFAVATSLALGPDGADVVASGSVPGGATWITASYDAATGALRWQVVASEGLGALDLVVGASRVYVTGLGVAPGPSSSLSVIAYDRATGQRLWRTDRRPPGSADAAGLRIALAPDGSVVATGQALRGFLDWYTVALETTGAVRWEAVRDGGLNTDEIPRSVLVLTDGTAVVTGPGGPNLPGGFIGGVTAGYGPDGALRWEAFSPLATVWAAALPDGQVCATGGYDAFVSCWRVAAPSAPPAPPTALAASLSGGAIRLTWLDHATDETAYQVERCTAADCSTSSLLSSLPADSTTFVDPVTLPTTYSYRVRAVNAAGGSAWSNVATVLVVGAFDPPSAAMTATPPTGPVPLSVTFDGSASFDFGGPIASWAWSFGDGAVGSGRIATHAYIAAGTYVATLTVTDGSGMTGSASTTVTVTQAPAPTLVAPTGLRATSTVRARVDLVWTNPVSSTTALRVERCRGSTCTAFAAVALLPATATAWRDTSVRSNTTYRYRVLASDATGGQVASSVVSVRVR